MKSLALSALLLSASLAVYADGGPLTGTWKLHNSIAGNESDQECSFTQKEGELTGSCKSEQGTVEIKGTVDQKKVNWIYKSEYNGGPITLTYSGNLDAADKISGSVKVEEYGVDGDFTATLSK